MEVRDGKYYKCSDKNGRPYLYTYDNKSGFDVHLYFTEQENPETLIMLKQAFANRVHCLTPEMLKDITPV